MGMTTNEAIEILRKNRPTSDTRPCGLELCDAVDMAISAIRQQEQERKTATGEGLRCKYIVRKADTGEGVDGCFVLRPDRDRAAVAALRAYASATDNDVLATDILNWVGRESNAPNDWICTMKCTALMDEGMCSHGGLCCLYESQRTIKENQPLTLDELRKMDGEPVWIHFIGGAVIRNDGWFIVSQIGTSEIFLSGKVSVYKNFWYYGETWLAYSQKPEEDDHG